ncbi:SRPBCC family protein [Halocatena pleomorpha]|uniref:Cyclase n=1 Tax=Halocatena pleomorpha TaxID=1785090 RepID=A0A3P3R879_9EURY|nr:SRPBCC family protein [Halocatena pleomorpha]RRJ29129.1 cyclase [Halocatena pleomorpha]
MPVFTRHTHVRASLDSVWEFHSSIDGLVALTPGVANLRIERVVDADGRPADRDQLVPGTRVEASVRPFGVGPRHAWTSVIVERTEEPGARVFVDEMQDGPFPHWRHTHAFYADGPETLLRDRIEYELPATFGPLSRFGALGFEPVFRYRHRQTKEILE